MTATATPPPLPLAAYGADGTGLIWGYHFREDGTVSRIDSPRAADWLADGYPREGFLWLHFNLAHAMAPHWLREHARLGEVFFEALEGGSRSSRIERQDDALLAVVNDVTFDFGFDPNDVATLWVNVAEGLVVSGRRQPLRSIDRLRDEVNRGEHLGSPVHLLDRLMQDQADELLRIVRIATERVDDIEDRVLAGHASRHAKELSHLRRLAVRLQRLLAPEPGALLRTLSRLPAWVPSEDGQRLRQASEEFGVVLRDIAALQDRIKLLQDECNAAVAEENNRSLFMLTTVTVMALPINLIAGLMGMNVGGIPWGDSAHGFAAVVALILLVTGALGAWVWRRVRRRDE